MAEIRVNATGGLKLYDADDSHYAQIVAGTITSNVDAITLGHNIATFNAAITAGGVLKTDDATEATSTTDGSLQTDGGLSVVKDAVFGDDIKLLSDSSVIAFGADGDTTLTHTDGTGLTLNSTNKLCFNDASQFVQGSSNAILALGATDEIDLTATAIDINGTADVSGAFTAGSTIVATGSITGTTIEPNADTSAGDNAAIGYTAAEGLILTGQGSTDDVTIKNDADTTVLQVATGGVDVEITAGNLIMGTSGKGIDFGATAGPTAGSGTSELLDDYEEGTWTPVYASTGATITNGSTTGGAYVKIGRLVTVQGSTSTGGAMSGGTAGNPVRIEGLPFTVDDDTSGENMRPTGNFDTWNSSYQWAEDGDQPSVVSAVNNQVYLYLSYRDAVDKYRIDTRFDDLQDSSSNPRNLAYFSITYMAG
jgi:hypothetical protein